MHQDITVQRERSIPLRGLARSGIIRHLLTTSSKHNAHCALQANTVQIPGLSSQLEIAMKDIIALPEVFLKRQGHAQLAHIFGTKELRHSENADHAHLVNSVCKRQLHHLLAQQALMEIGRMLKVLNNVKAAPQDISVLHKVSSLL